MLSGTRGAKYGLQLPGRKGTDVKALKAKVAVSKKPAIFAEESDEEDVGAEIARQAAKKRSDKELEQQHAAALAEDPNVFDYDGVYDQMKEAKAKPAQQQQAQRQPRYIEALLKKAKERERTMEMVTERKIHKEQEAEAHLYGDKEKFVTGAYKRKLAEDAKWREEERRREELEKANDVSTKGDLSDFYRNLLSKNEAFGGGARAVAAPAIRPPAEATAPGPDTRNEATEETSGAAKEGVSEPASLGTEGVEERGLLDEGVSKQQLEDKKTRVEDESSWEDETRVGDPAGSAQHEGEEQRERGKGGRVGDSGHVAVSDRPMAAEKKSHGDAVAPVKKTEAVADAKARYLARKKQKI